MKRELNTKESVRTVTSNQFITACGLEGIWITYISRKKIISFDKQKSTKTRMFS